MPNCELGQHKVPVTQINKQGESLASDAANWRIGSIVVRTGSEAI